MQTITKHFFYFVLLLKNNYILGDFLFYFTLLLKGNKKYNLYFLFYFRKV